MATSDGRLTDSYSIVPDKPVKVYHEPDLRAAVAKTQSSVPLTFLGEGETVPGGGPKEGEEEEVKGEDTLHQDFAVLLESLEEAMPTGYGNEQPVLIERIKNLLKMQGRIDRAGVFSNNETHEDVNTEMLKFALCPHHLSESYNRLYPLKGSRVEALELCKKWLKRFLNRMLNWEVMNKEQQRLFEDPDALRTAHPAQRRALKISGWKRKSESAKRIEQLRLRRKNREKQGKTEGDGDYWDEASERELWMESIKLAVQTSLDSIRGIDMELPMAKMSDEARKKQGKGKMVPLPRDIPPPVDHVKKPLKVTDIKADGKAFNFDNLAQFGKFKSKTIDQVVKDRTNIRAEILRNVNPWTMTVEEALELDIASGEVQMNKEPEPEKQTEDQMTEAEHDADQMKKREWDKWKDDHERGAGNFKGRD